MADSLEERTLNSRLIEEGFTPIAAINSSDLPERLTPLLVQQARGLYSDIKVIPGNLAFADSGRTTTVDQHFVYVKFNKENPLYKEGMRIVFVDTTDSNGNYFPSVPLHCL